MEFTFVPNIVLRGPGMLEVILLNERRTEVLKVLLSHLSIGAVSRAENVKKQIFKP